MARLSERNLFENISTTVTFNFVRGEWENKPDNLPEGCRLAHRLIESVMGCEMRPVPSWQVFNYDMTSYYAFNGTSHRSGNGNEWSRVPNESLDRGRRNHTSIKKNGEESVCNGLTVRWMDCANASGDLLPIVQIFEGFGEDIMPKDDYLFLEVPGLPVGSTTDARLSDAPGYVAFKKLGASMMPFHTWYNLTILAPYYQQVRKKYGYSSEDTELPEQEHVRVYCDSDMTNIACLTNYAEMERNHKKDLAFAKFGSKTTDWCHPMDVGTGFKQKKQMAKFTTTEARDQPLEQAIRGFLASKHAQGQFMLQKGHRKYEAIVECVATGPRIHASAWEHQKIEKAFVDAGFIDRVTKTCPDIYQMMSMCGIDFDKNRLRREAFIDNLETVIAEHVRCGYVSEEFFDTLGLTVDMDAHGREYPLTATTTTTNEGISIG
jgi:hypothetical protein